MKEKEWEQKIVYRVWYGEQIEHEAFFTVKRDAQEFAEKVNGHLNKWLWEMKIEK